MTKEPTETRQTTTKNGWAVVSPKGEFLSVLVDTESEARGTEWVLRAMYHKTGCRIVRAQMREVTEVPGPIPADEEGTETK
jgi:hypothetical protein